MDNKTDLPLVSVIIPVYNTEQYVGECIESILNQSYKRIEIIIVDDGSTDKGGTICEQYAHLNSNILVKHKVNGGLSDARNYGLSVCKGDYICFVDSDDTVSKDYIETFINLIQKYNVKVAVCGIENWDGKQKHLHQVTGNQEIRSSLDILHSFFIDGKFKTSAWGKIFQKSLWENISFPKGFLYEDFITIWKVIGSVENIAVTSASNYFYRNNLNGIMNSPFNRANMDIIYAHEIVIKEIHNYFPCLIPTIKARYGRFATIFLKKAILDSYTNTEDLELLRSAIRRNIYYLMRSHASLKLKTFAISSCIGLRFAKLILKLN